MQLAAYRRAAVAAALVLTVAGCRYRPGGTALVFHISTEKEFNVWRMERPESSVGQQPIQLKWYDTSTYVTYDQMPPGPYVLAVRRSQGPFYRIQFDIVPDKWYYEFADPSTAGGVNDMATTGPRVRARIVHPGAKPPDHVIIVFAGKDVLTRRSGVMRGGLIEVDAPRAGRYRIEIIAPGEPPRSWASPFMDVASPVDLGEVTLN